MASFQSVTRLCAGKTGLSPEPAAARLLGLRVRILAGAWMFVSCEYCVLSGRGVCDGSIPSPEESYRLCECHIVWSGATVTLYTCNE